MRRGRRSLRFRDDRRGSRSGTQNVRASGRRCVIGWPMKALTVVGLGVVIGLSSVLATGCAMREPWKPLAVISRPSPIPQRPSPVIGRPSPLVGLGGVACDVAQPSSTHAGVALTVDQALLYAYRAGFHTVSELQAVVGIGEAESSLVTQTRRWHPEYGCRPASNAIGVLGPATVWNTAHTQQMHSDRGVWQISSHFWPQYTDAQTDNPATAAQATWEISSHGTDFGRWDTYPSPALSVAPSAATVQAFLATR